MRIVDDMQVHEWGRHFPDASSALAKWLDIAQLAQWRSIQDVRSHFPHADAVTVASGRTATIFNIAGNKYRLVTAVHYNTRIVFTMLFLTHAEYSKELWKEKL